MRKLAFFFVILFVGLQAHAQQSTSYQIPSDVQGAGGGEEAKSTNYRLEDTLGEQGIGFSGSQNYELNAGYRNTLETYLSLSAPTELVVGTIAGNGQATASGTWTVTTDNPAGYSLHWKVSTGSGGVNTGSLISQRNHAIHPINMSGGGLVGYWKMDELIAGSSVKDLSGNGNDGTPDGTGGANIKPQPSAALPDNPNFSDVRSLDFDGTDDFVSVPVTSSHILNITGNQITQTAWIYPTADVAYGTIATRNAGYYFQRHSNGKLGSYHYGTSPAGYLYSTGTAPLNQWSHVAYVYNGSTITFYINGVPSGSTNKTGSVTQLPGYVNEPFRIGWDSSGGSRYFKGKMDEVRIYNRALSAEEIKELSNTPQDWSVPSTDAAWGARLMSVSTDTDARWGTDNASEKWLHIGDGDYTFASRSTRTSLAGSDEILQLRTEIGSQKIQPDGVYKATVLVTATAL